MAHKSKIKKLLSKIDFEKLKNKKTIIILVVTFLVVIVGAIFLLVHRASNTGPKNNCKFDGDLTFKTQYVNGQYTYTYLNSKWGVTLTDKESTEPVTTKLCTHINNFPITEMDSMFAKSKATSIDLSSFNTSKVTSMANMFSGAEVTELDFSSFKTSKVQNMAHMFWNSKIKNLDLSTFETKKVTNMANMFGRSEIETLNISNFNFKNVRILNVAVFPDNIKSIVVRNNKDVELISNLKGMDIPDLKITKK